MNEDTCSICVQQLFKSYFNNLQLHVAVEKEVHSRRTNNINTTIYKVGQHHTYKLKLGNSIKKYLKEKYHEVPVDGKKN